MKGIDYINEIKKRFEYYFEMEEDVYLGDARFDIKATYEEVCGRTFISQVDIIDRFERYEKCYITSVMELNEETTKNIIKSVEGAAHRLNPTTIDHMSTNITGVIVCQRLNCDVSWLRKYKFTKWYAYSFKGWCDVHFIIVDLENKKVHTCKRSKNRKKVFDIWQKVTKAALA